jgi:hypothetical protein
MKKAGITDHRVYIMGHGIGERKPGPLHEHWRRSAAA